jgi:hypothetical protein
MNLTLYSHYKNSDEKRRDRTTMTTGTELAERLLNNINTSLALRTHIPYLDTLRDLIEGGVTPTTAMMNTSSNFGSFDSNLKVVLSQLSAANSLIINPTQPAPLSLSTILVNLTTNMDLLIKLLQDAAEDNLQVIGTKEANETTTSAASKLVLESLEQINRSSV